ncbi:MAG: tyrosine-type recombinase/integrase [Acidimicrobiales bacterium]
MARRPARHQGAVDGEEHPTPTAPHDPHLLRAAHRVGLARRPHPEPDPPWRHPAAARAVAEVPRRPRRRQAHGHRTRPPPAPLSDRGRDPRPHRSACRRALRPRARRRHPDRRRALAAGAGREAPQRPLIPLHPDLVALLAEWTAANVDHIRAKKRLLADEHALLDRRTVHRIVATVARQAGIGHAHPHQLRHTLATQAINRGMRLEAIAALLGHRSMEMTLTYAKIADRVVADEAITAQIDALYAAAGSPGAALPADIETKAMERLRREAHARMLGNGLCTRPVELECRMESACETCAYFQTGPEFVPVLIRQRDHARDNNQPDRATLFDGLLDRIAGEGA